MAAAKTIKHRGIVLKKDALGYSSPFNFSTLFRKHYGYSPGKKT